MRICDVKKLQAGDEVRWNDPDQGLCSKTIKIKAIWQEGNIVNIEDENGDFLQCFCRELR